MRRDHERLLDSAEAVAAAIGDHEDAFGLILERPELRLLGFVAELTDTERGELWGLLLLSRAKRARLERLVKRLVEAPALHAALSRAYPSWVSDPNRAWAEYRARLRALPHEPELWGMQGVTLAETFVTPALQVGQDVHSDGLAWLKLTLGNPKVRGVLVVGEPGAGKTGLLSMLAADLANDPEAFPILVPARRLAPGRRLRPAVEQFLAETEPTLLAALRQNPKVTLILDGWDEAPQNTGRAGGLLFRAREFGRTTRVVASVTAVGQPERPARAVAVAQIRPFDAEKLEAWAARWFISTGRAIDVRAIEGDSLGADLGRPMYFTLLAAAPDHQRMSGARLLQTFADDRCRALGAVDPRSGIERRFLRLAGFLSSLRGDSSYWPDALMAKHLNHPIDGIDGILGRAADLRIVVGPPDHWAFVHLALAEYLGAEYLLPICQQICSAGSLEVWEPERRLDLWRRGFSLGLVSDRTLKFLCEQLTPAERDSLIARLRELLPLLTNEAEPEAQVRLAGRWMVRPSFAFAAATTNVIRVWKVAASSGAADVGRRDTFLAAYRQVDSLFSLHGGACWDEIQVPPDVPAIGAMTWRLPGAKLDALDLRGFNFSHAYLDGASLRGADCRDAIMYMSSLVYADLRGARLSNAQVFGGSWMGADLRGADVRGADLRNLDLSRADLRGADLRGANVLSTDWMTAIHDATTRWPDGHRPPLQNPPRAVDDVGERHRPDGDEDEDEDDIS